MLHPKTFIFALPVVTRTETVPEESLKKVTRSASIQHESRGTTPIFRNAAVPLESRGWQVRRVLVPFEAGGSSVARRVIALLEIDGVDPDTLPMVWNVLGLMDATLFHDWNVRRLGGEFTLPMQWATRQQLFALPMIWNVFPDLFSLFGVSPIGVPLVTGGGLGPGDVSQPTSEVTMA